MFQNRNKINRHITTDPMDIFLRQIVFIGFFITSVTSVLLSSQSIDEDLEALGLTSENSVQDVERICRRLKALYHPDKPQSNPKQAVQNFLAVTEICERLKEQLHQTERKPKNPKPKNDEKKKKKFVKLLDRKLIEAVKAKNIVKADDYLQKGANPNIVVEENGITLLELISSWAKTKNDRDTVLFAKLLLKYGAHINAQDQYGRTPLHRAAENLNLPLVRLLLNNGSPVNSISSYGATPLYEAASACTHNGKESASIGELLLDRDASINGNDARIPLVAAAGSLECNPFIKMLLKYGPDVDAQDREGLTALMQSALISNKPIVKLLVDHGARIDLKNKNDETVIQLLRRKGKHDMANYIEHLSKRAHKAEL